MKVRKTEQDYAHLQRLSKFLIIKKTKDKLRYRNLALKSGLARCSVSKIINGKQDINFTTLVKLLNAMEIEVNFKEKTK